MIFLAAWVFETIPVLVFVRWAMLCLTVAICVQMVTDFDRILYISCNPDTLANNLEEITKTHRVDKFAVFDQFPCEGDACKYPGFRFSACCTARMIHYIHRINVHPSSDPCVSLTRHFSSMCRVLPSTDTHHLECGMYLSRRATKRKVDGDGVVNP